ncbi:MAG: hypothetical protein J7K00_04860 [Candidatus Diapherotrites archaeon]|nr:hypothetical protein [Candidatus Diapherotrites archaeon]
MKKGDSSWGALYLLIVLVIAAVLITTVIKPMFSQSQEAVTSKKLPSSMGLIGLAAVFSKRQENTVLEKRAEDTSTPPKKNLVQTCFTAFSSVPNASAQG